MKASETNRAAARARTRIERCEKAVEELDDLEVSWEVLSETGAPSSDSGEFKDFTAKLDEFESRVEALEVAALLSGEFDDSPAIVTIHAGAGGTESHDWVDMLTRMYFMFAEKEGFTAGVLDHSPGDVAGTKSITFRLQGGLAYGYLKCERGVHRLVRISPFDFNKRRHTSFAAVDVIPEIDEAVEVEIADGDLKTDTYRASGAGGQHVNKTDSAVRITHLPTGVVVSCQNERSQHKNRDQAMKVLKSRLAELLRREHKERVEELRGERADIAWGNQIRSYVLQPYQLVKDLRTNHETSNVDAVLDGAILPYIWALLKSDGRD